MLKEENLLRWGQRWGEEGSYLVWSWGQLRPNIHILIRDFNPIVIYNGNIYRSASSQILIFLFVILFKFLFIMDIFIGQLGPQLFLHRLCRLSGGISKTTNYFLVYDYWMIFHPQVTGWKSRQIQTSNFQRIFLIARSQGADWPSLLVASASLAGPWQGWVF